MKCLKVCPCLASLWSRDPREKSEDQSSLKEIEIPTIITSELPQCSDVMSEMVEPTKMHEEPWFFGVMNRFDAEALLRSPENQIRTFLIRRSDHDSGAYVLSVKCSPRVKHFKVHQDKDNNYYIEPSQFFSSLHHLVEYYRKYSLRELGTLRESCKRPEVSEIRTGILELSKEEFTLEKELGSGSFTDVYRGTWKNNVSVAIKIIKDPKLKKQEFQSVLQTLKDLRHHHLVSLFAICTESPPYYIVTELMEKGSLLQFLRGPDGQHQDIVSLVDMGTQVADGMAYLEEKNIVHRDLAARNVLLGEDYICKVSDFALAQIKNPYENQDDSSFSCKWSAPEVMSHLKFSNKSDVWSFGVLLYEIITFGGSPYKDLSDNEVYEQLTVGYRMPCPPKCPEFLYNIMKECWRAKPEQRPTFKNLMHKLDVESYE